MSTILNATETLDQATNVLMDGMPAELADEARALATMIKSFRDRLSLSKGPPEAPKKRTSADLKHWTAAELERLGRRVPFSPTVYGSGFWHREEKRFHVPTCPYARDGESMDLEIALELGFKPCKECGGVRFDASLLEVATKIDKLLHYIKEIRSFALCDYSGMIDEYDAAKILGTNPDELVKQCKVRAKEQLGKYTEDRFFKLHNEVRVLRYKHSREATIPCFRFMREDCVHMAKKWGR